MRDEEQRWREMQRRAAEEQARKDRVANNLGLSFVAITFVIAIVLIVNNMPAILRMLSHVH